MNTLPNVWLGFMFGDTLDVPQKTAVYAYLYGSAHLLLEGIDEEGCGAVFAAVLFGD
jgi:hypothetical protein